LAAIKQYRADNIFNKKAAHYNAISVEELKTA